MTAKDVVTVAVFLAAAVPAGLAAEADPRAPSELKATPDAPLGRRGDGSGRFAGAEPVSEWSASMNVVWRTPMPDWSTADPVVVGEVLFVCSEPTTLLCVRRSDGKVLWHRTHDYEDLLPPGEREQVKNDLLTAERLRVVELEPIRRKLQEVNRQLQGMPDDRYLRSTKNSLERQKKAVEDRVAELEKWRPPRADPMLGHAHSTPVTDGAGVFAVFGNGVGAVYDLEGNGRWSRVIRRAQIGCGPAMSPVLADKVLVMGIDNEVLGVHAATGRDVWRHELKQPTAGLAMAKVGDLRVVVTAEGDVLRASDGKLLAQVQGAARPAPTAPVVQKDVAYLFGEGSQLLAVLLEPDGTDGVRASRLGAVRVFAGAYHGSCLYHEGCVYLWEKGNVLTAVSARSGQAIATRRLTLGGAAWSSPTLGGESIFLGADNGTMAVVRPRLARSPGGRLGFEIQEVGRNVLEPFRSSPVFAGREMYLRTLKALYCIGPVGPVEGKQPPAPKPKPVEIDADELLR